MKTNISPRNKSSCVYISCWGYSNENVYANVHRGTPSKISWKSTDQRWIIHSRMEQRHDILFQVLDRFVCTLVGEIFFFVWEIYKWILFPYQWMEQKISNFHWVSTSNFMTKGYRSSHNETAASAWRQRNADWWSEMKKTNHNIHHPEILQLIHIHQWIQMMKLLEDWEVLIYIA